MGKKAMSSSQQVQLFNGPIEIGLRCLVILCEAFPKEFSLQQLVILDYLTVHSDDLPDGPKGLHPQTPYRSGELLVRREVLQQGIMLYLSRGLIDQHFTDRGVFFVASEQAGGFVDALDAQYIRTLRHRASWIVNGIGTLSEVDLDAFVRDHLGKWGAEFEWASVLWAEDA